MSEVDPFALNILGASQLVNDDANKTLKDDGTMEEGVQGEYIDVLELELSDEELIALTIGWENKSNQYLPKIKTRQDRNKVYYAGKQAQADGTTDKVVSSNLLFEAEETFIPQALSKNPEPVVWSDNTDEGKDASNDVKTMLQYHADVLCLRRTLGVMVRHWSVYFLGVIKHGWDKETNDISMDIRKPQNFLLDPDGYVDVFGNFVGDFLGERIEATAERMIELFPKHKDYILIKADGKLGTNLVYTEWWTNEYCFTKFQEVVLDKHKNEFFAYDETTKHSEEDQLAHGLPEQVVMPAMNHFATPKMPYTFLSVFSLQETPHDITNLIEQGIPNQDRIVDRDIQISRNLRASNNSLVLSMLHGWTAENAAEGAQAVEDGSPILAPGEISAGIQRLPASALPSGVLEAQENDKQTLRSVFGTLGLTSQPQNEDTTARGMILNQSHDSSRIGGGIGDALEQVADNIFNWWLQLYCVFYDEPHYAAIMGSGRAVEYATLTKQNMNRHFVVSVAAGSMQPKDEITEMNMAIELANSGWLDPIGLFKKLYEPDPMETAKRVTMWKINPQQYFMTYFPEMAPQMQQAQGVPANPADMNAQAPPPDASLAQDPASSALSQVPLSAGIAQPK